MDSNNPFSSPSSDAPTDTPPVRPSHWSKTGFFVGIGLFVLAMIMTFSIFAWALALGLVVAVGLGLYYRKFGFVTGYIAGGLLCVGLLFLAIVVFCGVMAMSRPR